VKILIASKILVQAAYRRKLDEIAARPEVERLVVVTPPAWQEPGGRTLSLEPAPGDRAYDLRIEPIRFNGSYHFFYWPGLARVLREVRPDLVHADEEPYNLATFHATRLAARTGTRSLFFAWQNLLRRYPPPFNWFEQSVFRRSAFAIAGSRDALQVLRAKGFGGPASVIPQFGVDPELFKPGDAAPPEPPIIGFIGRLVEEKGILGLLAALAGLDRPWRLHVLGSGPLEQKARQVAARLGVADRVIWERGIPSTLVPVRLRTFSVLVQPSLTRRHWKEQFGRAIMEAMACGVPVVGFASGEIPNVVGDAGMVAPEADWRALGQAIGRVLDDADLRADLGRRGRARVLACYTNRRLAEHTVQAYQTALGSAAPAAGATIV
jgi:glycosyltransferase involved in cell wall biosynthesis